MHTHVYIPFLWESDYSISPMITLSASSYKNAPRIKHREKLEHFSLINSPHRWNFPSAAIQRGVLEPAVLKAQYSDLFFRLHADINWFQIELFISRNTRCLSWTKLSKWLTQCKRRELIYKSGENKTFSLDHRFKICDTDLKIERKFKTLFRGFVSQLYRSNILAF